MDRRYSAIDDMYGVGLGNEPPRRRGRGFLYVVLLLAGLFVFESLQPVMRLRSDPPAGFVGARVDSNEAEYREQQRTARACWDYAIHSLQQSYPYGQPLPKNPPQASGNSVGNTSAISVLCWPRLRRAWTQSESWVEKYEWSTDWVTNPHSTFQRTVRSVTNYLRASL